MIIAAIAIALALIFAIAVYDYYDKRKEVDKND